MGIMRVYKSRSQLCFDMLCFCCKLMAAQSVQVNIHCHTERGAPPLLIHLHHFGGREASWIERASLLWSTPAEVSLIKAQLQGSRGAAPACPCVFTHLLQCKHTALLGEKKRMLISKKQCSYQSQVILTILDTVFFLRYPYDVWSLRPLSI